jgi:hypothetical protein
LHRVDTGNIAVFYGYLNFHAQFLAQRYNFLLTYAREKWILVIIFFSGIIPFTLYAQHPFKNGIVNGQDPVLPQRVM